MSKKSSPKFEVGQAVQIGRVRTPLMDYTGLQGKVVQVEGMLKAVKSEQDGIERVERGPRMPISHVAMIKPEHWWDGELLMIRYDSGDTWTYAPDGYSYTVRMPGVDHMVALREKDLRKA